MLDLIYKYLKDTIPENRERKKSVIVTLHDVANILVDKGIGRRCAVLITQLSNTFKGLFGSPGSAVLILRTFNRS